MLVSSSETTKTASHDSEQRLLKPRNLTLLILKILLPEQSACIARTSRGHISAATNLQ